MNTFIYVMVFYIVLSYLIGPGLGYAFGKSYDAAGHGFVVGSLLSIVLWYTVGQKKVNSA
jgi:membrane associated rhomboid family serine protease